MSGSCAIRNIRDTARIGKSKTMTTRIVLACFAATCLSATALFSTSVYADEKPYEVAQAFYDIYVDQDGNRFLVDPDTGHVVGPAPDNRSLTRRQQRRADRRNKRRNNLQRELGNLFGLRTREEPKVNTRQKPAVRRNAPRKSTVEDEVARLPGFERPTVGAKPRTSGKNYSGGKPGFNRNQMASLQVLLDREGFSPGAIDGKWGSNVAKAMSAWKEAKGSELDLSNYGRLEDILAGTGGSAIVSYTITAKDAATPLVKSVPVDYALKAELPALSYTSMVEMLAEKFHMSQSYLRHLNPGKRFAAGTTIKVAATGERKSTKVSYIVADKNKKQIRAYDRNGALVVAYPATIGSAATPSPTGSHSVTRIAVNPEYTYNPKKNFQQGENDKILRIAPGPNGPVGSVWIALSKPTYGIHGTPNPETIGKTNSHGCIRLTNWDARELAKLVQRGATVEFTE